MKIVIEENISNVKLKYWEKKILLRPRLKLAPNPEESFLVKRDVTTRQALERILWLLRQFKSVYVKSGKLQCLEGAFRSQGDLYRILRYYKPKVSFREFRANLFAIAGDNMLYVSYCDDIHKRIFYSLYENAKVSPKHYYELTRTGEEDEFGVILKYTQTS